MSSPIEQRSMFNNDGANVRSHRVRRATALSSNSFLSITVNDEPIDSLVQPVLIQGHAFDALDLLPENSIQTVVTSPPYWSLRDYAVNRQIGCDESLADYLVGIVKTFDKIRRVLKADGTIWLNVGDAYTSGNRRYRAPDKKNRARAMSTRPVTPDGLKPKDLIGLPWRLAFALQDAGWWLRSEIIWSKPNAHPESVRDRPTKAHEIVFLLSKKSGLLLRCKGSPWTEWPPSSDDLGNSDGTPETKQWHRGRSSGRHAGGACPALCENDKQARRLRT